LHHVPMRIPRKEARAYLSDHHCPLAPELPSKMVAQRLPEHLAHGELATPARKEFAMSAHPFHLTEEPTELSVSLLARSLRIDSATKGVSPKNYAHRSRVIRQQTELLARKMAGDADQKQT